jgi:phosphoglucosamine mutase
MTATKAKASGHPTYEKIFGTDGVRGVANVHPMTAEIALKLGRAAARVFCRDDRRHKIVVGKDTRLSGYMLENAIVAGLTSMGVDALLIGPLPTPGVAYITRSLRADAGIVITASHNSYEDNGIKFFRSDGYKLDDGVEDEIERLVFSDDTNGVRPTAEAIGKAFRIDDALGRYIEYAKRAFPSGRTLEGMQVAVDCGNGAAYKSTPCVLRELGADVAVFHNAPDGKNINAGCGSTYPEEISRLVRETGAAMGIAHDGDADRVILADETGAIVDGDEVLAVVACDYLRRDALKGNTLVATIMSNAGLDECLREHGGRTVRTKVGDRYVIEEMMRHGYNVGGEQSGHMIFRDYSTTGDGLVSALQVLRVMAETGRPLSELRRIMRKYPQRLVNVKVRERRAFESMPAVLEALRSVEEELGDGGRVFLRYSGTEAKVRLLLESREASVLDALAERILEPLRREIGIES